MLFKLSLRFYQVRHVSDSEIMVQVCLPKPGLRNMRSKARNAILG